MGPAIVSSRRRGHWRSVWDRTARFLGFRPASRLAEQTDEAPTHPPPGPPGNAVPRLEHHPAPMPAPELQPYAFVQETVREFITSHRHLVDNMVEVVDNMVEVVRLTSQRNCDHTQLGDSTGSRPASGPGTLGSSQAVLPGQSVVKYASHCADHGSKTTRTCLASPGRQTTVSARTRIKRGRAMHLKTWRVRP